MIEIRPDHTNEKMNLLIVEDDKRTALNLQSFINESFKNTVATTVSFSAEEAISLAKKNRYDLIMTDICMPGIDGLEMIRHLFALYPKMNIVVLSAYDDFDFVRQAFKLGVKDYLLKPLDRVELHRIFHDMMNSESDDQSEPGENVAKQKIIDRVKKQIKDNLATNISLSSLAEAVNLNPQYLSTVFKDITGENLFSYVARKRVEKAQSLLAESNLKIYEISEIVGYSDTKYFSYVFKKATGKTPIEYRDYITLRSLQEKTEKKEK